jgi:hypothetical protein
MAAAVAVALAAATQHLVTAAVLSMVPAVAVLVLAPTVVTQLVLAVLVGSANLLHPAAVVLLVQTVQPVLLVTDLALMAVPALR